ARLGTAAGSDPGGQPPRAGSRSKARGTSGPGTCHSSARDRSRRLVTMFPPSSSAPREEAGLGATLAEVRREIACRVCQGDIKRCRLAICPYLDRVRAWFTERRDLQTKNLFGASPPSAFVGSWGYPKVLVGPLVPPVRDEDTSILDASESWLSYDLAEILRFRLSLVRGKAPRRVAEARTPDSILSTVQEAAMASKPIDTEMWFTRKPTLVSPFSARAPPSGPSADLTKIDLTSNPSVPRRVDDLVSDTDLRAGDAVTRSRVRGRPDDVPGPDRGRIPRDPPSGPRAPRGPSKAGGCDRLHGGLRGLGAARGLAVPRARAGRPRQEAVPIRGLRIGRGGDQPTSSPPARQLVAGQRPPGLPAEPTPYHVVRVTSASNALGIRF